MIVIDASAMIELLLGTSCAPAVRSRVLDSGELMLAPHVLDLEIAQALRRYCAAGDLDAARGAEALEDLAAMPIHRVAHDVLLPRIWELRNNVTAYDAAYLALAEASGAPLVTCDRALAGAPGHEARVEVF